MLVGQIQKRYKSGPQMDQRGKELIGTGQSGGFSLLFGPAWDQDGLDIGSPDVFTGDGKHQKGGLGAIMDANIGGLAMALAGPIAKVVAKVFGGKRHKGGKKHKSKK